MAGMGESVTYADLRFSKAPPGRSVNPWAQGTAPPAPGEADGSYENLHLDAVGKGPARHGAQQWREPRWSTRPLLLGLLAACLALLVTTIALGVCYWQERQQLQQASHAHTAERNGLWQQVGTQEQRLEQAGAALVQAQEEMARTRAELAQAWQEGNRSRKELHHRDTELQETRVQLDQMQKQAWDLRQQLNKTESALASARPCQVTDCCPETWVLHRGKCLFLSKEKKTWQDSRKACEKKDSQLLILHNWDQMKMPSFLTATDASYWIGLMRDWEKHQWTWIDGTEYSDVWKLVPYAAYGVFKGGSIKVPEWRENKFPWICEKKASRPWGATESNPGV
ncbi:PREDICTED: B-cell differentiation antigen CD72 [Gavialis gangeticus]|uniref:B-cell differentiation antigen CD72 n=1 Tax=Gavialis gangeticus TaxID=94835 RepID=UPI00092E5603|nr:PREDICTED: B-cell differentiation antigen CD72 [Gavialis gangeticus]